MSDRWRVVVAILVMAAAVAGARAALRAVCAEKTLPRLPGLDEASKPAR